MATNQKKKYPNEGSNEVAGRSTPPLGQPPQKHRKLVSSSQGSAVRASQEEPEMSDVEITLDPEEDPNFPKIGDCVQVAFVSNPGVWCRCTVVGLDHQSEGFNVRYGGGTYFVYCMPRESWRTCPKDTQIKVKLTQEESDMVSAY